MVKFLHTRHICPTDLLNSKIFIHSTVERSTNSDIPNVPVATSATRHESKRKMPQKRSIPASSIHDNTVEIVSQSKRAKGDGNERKTDADEKSNESNTTDKPDEPDKPNEPDNPDEPHKPDEPDKPDDPDPPRKRAGKYTKKKNKKNRSFTSVKCSLNSIIQQGDRSKLIVQVINELVIRTTKICFIAALMVLDMVNRNFDEAKRTRNWSFFDSNSPTSFIVDCFQAVTQSSRRALDHPFMTTRFRALMNQYGIPFENTALMSNIFKYVTQRYEINFKNNIVVHAKVRLRVLIKLKMIQRNGGLPDANMTKTINNTLNFMFNPKSKCSKDDDLINFVLWYIPNDIDVGNSENRGFMSLCIKQHWFQFVPIFMRIQREVHAYHRESRRNGTPIRLRNFKVVPLHCHRRTHIKIDNVSFKRILEYLKIHPTKLNPRTLRTNALPDAEFIAARIEDERDPTRTYNPHWFSFLNWPKIKKMERQSKEFAYEIVTDGVSVSISFERNKTSPPESFEELLEKQAEKYSQFGRNYINNLYQIIIGMDPGYKLYISALMKNVTTNVENHIKISSKKFYSMIRQNNRDKKAKKWTEQYEHAAQLDREDTSQYTEYPSSKSPEYFNYIKHSMKFFKDGIEIYTTRKYSRLHLDKHIRTQQAMDSIVHTLTDELGNGRILLCIGATEFNPASPIKKYKRCPGTRQIMNFMRKVLVCDIVFVDEYNTSKACGCCYRQFNKTKHKYWEGKGIRHRVCDNCHPDSSIINLPNTIITPKSQRQLQNEKREMRRNMYLNNAAMTWDEVVDHVDLYFNMLIPESEMYNRYQKVPFDESIHKPVQKLVWNRDISAARNILAKGICLITEHPVPLTLTRRTHTQVNAQANPEADDDTDSDSERNY